MGPDLLLLSGSASSHHYFWCNFLLTTKFKCRFYNKGWRHLAILIKLLPFHALKVMLYGGQSVMTSVSPPHHLLVSVPAPTPPPPNPFSFP
ncbi:hypothetical protein RRG08_028435 [Elysia crispata]|uniref:Uncharacterized protein n=1 Tax=Elysia crispata TaxID=231223 RepID=A0AAE1AVB1_9GAST|nr:hypothetical protein RRG08_028435 [Elysia crispata]